MESFPPLQTLSRFKGSMTVSQLAAEFKKEVQLGSFKETGVRTQELLRKFSHMENRYRKVWHRANPQEWREEERKLFVCFVLAYCRLYFKKFSEITDPEWAQFSACFHHKHPLLLKYEVRSIERNPQRVHWLPQEEHILQLSIKSNLNGRWAAISKRIFFDSDGQCFKTPKQCREHWFNHMNKTIKKGEWTVEEDLIILQSVLKEGRKWARIADQLVSQRTEHMIKNRFNSLMTCARKMADRNIQSQGESGLISFFIQEIHSKKHELKAIVQEEEEKGQQVENGSVAESLSDSQQPSPNHQSEEKLRRSARVGAEVKKEKRGEGVAEGVGSQDLLVDQQTIKEEQPDGETSKRPLENYHAVTPQTAFIYAQPSVLPMPVPMAVCPSFGFVFLADYSTMPTFFTFP